MAVVGPLRGRTAACGAWLGSSFQVTNGRIALSAQQFRLDPVTRADLSSWLAPTSALVVVILLCALLSFALLARRRTGPSSPSSPAQPGLGPPAGVVGALLEHIPDPVIIVDHRALVLEANGAARGLLPALKTRQPLSFALRNPNVLEALERVVQHGGAVRTDFAERIPTERRFEVQVATLTVDQPDPSARPWILLFFRDLTPAWRVERMRADFVANASHELRTPLASILGFVETLQGPARNDPAARERFLDIMREQARRMTRLIDDLLALSRIEMRAHLPVTRAVDLRSMVTRVIDALEPLARERGLEVALTGSEGPAWVLGDQDELLRVAENILENAIKYGESGGMVEVQIRRLDASEGCKPAVDLSVRDYGPGIASEHLPRLTERFYRVDLTASRQQGGTGLGLALVKHIVTRHRGRLVIESELGTGTTVRVILPEVADADAMGSRLQTNHSNPP